MVAVVVVMVSVELAPAVTEGGLKLAVMPAGAPEVLRVTDSGEPLMTVVLIDDVAD